MMKTNVHKGDDLATGTGGEPPELMLPSVVETHNIDNSEHDVASVHMYNPLKMQFHPPLSYIQDMTWEDLGSEGTTTKIQTNLITQNASILEHLLCEALYHNHIVATTDRTRSISAHLVFDGDDKVFLSTPLKQQLLAYITRIANSYHAVGFHNFSHASHVLLSATKLITIIKSQHYDTSRDLTDTIYDPWLHFAISFAALLHDVDHRGIPNCELAAAQHSFSIKYNSHDCMSSYAEWQSINLSFDILINDDSGEFKLLRDVLFGGSGSGHNRFQDIITDLILSTDIASGERQKRSKNRWETFLLSQDSSKVPAVQLNSKFDIAVITDQIMQVADVSHTMQRWDTFLQWNKKLFYEMLSAYSNGHANVVGSNDTNPAQNWFSNEIAFYDHYIIPLANRLENCGVFRGMKNNSNTNGDGHSLALASLARRNRDRWMQEGKEVTRIMVESGQSITLPSVVHLPAITSQTVAVSDIEYMAQELENNDEYSCINDNSTHCKIDKELENMGSSFKRNDMDDELSENAVPLTSADDASFSSIEDCSMVKIQGDSKATSIQCIGNWNFHDGLKSSVEAIVPRILVKQVLNSLRIECCQQGERGNREESALMQEKAIQTALLKYRKTGSIQRYRGSLLFVDISGFTNLSQNYPIEDLKTFINEYFSEIVNLIELFDGDVVKFAGDAIYALWYCDNTIACADSAAQEEAHVTNVAKCTACGISIIAKCNDYKVSMSYNKKGDNKGSLRNTFSSSDSISKPQGQGHVMYTFQDKDAQYECRSAKLYVHCGVSEGTMAGVNTISIGRAEFFLIGQPLADVATAEGYAGKGQLVISSSVYKYLERNKFFNQKKNLSDIKFESIDDKFHKIILSDYLSLVGISPSFYHEEDCSSTLVTLVTKDDVYEMIENFVIFYLKETAITDEMNDIKRLKSITAKDNSIIENFNGELASERYVIFQKSSKNLQLDILNLLECHRHEATHGIVGKLSAELRRVVVLFIKVGYEPTLSINVSQDEHILDSFQSIFDLINNSIKSWNGQVRQFINDDKGTVCIVSFGLRGSVMLNAAATAINAAQDIVKALALSMNIKSFIGITLGKVFCGETGSSNRYEYSLMGPSVNLAARLMAKQSASIICDEEVRSSDNSSHNFRNAGMHTLKGYNDPVPFYEPVDESYSQKHPDSCNVKPKRSEKLLMRQGEIRDLVEYIKHYQHRLEYEEYEEPLLEEGTQCNAIIVSGLSGTGRTEFITNVLEEPSIQENIVLLQSNKCFHDTPFYCLIPIIIRIVLVSNKLGKRLSKIKKGRKGFSTMYSLLRIHNSCKVPSVLNYDDLVSDELTPFLGVINDFIFQGFPVIKKTGEVKLLKGDKKITKCIEVLSALIVRFIDRCQKDVFISIPDIDSIDDYSKRLVQTLFNTQCKFTIIGSIEQHTEKPSSNMLFRNIFGCIDDRDCKSVHLEPLSNDSILDLFKWSLRDIVEYDWKLFDTPIIAESICQICGGIARFAVELARAVSLQWTASLESLPLSKDERHDYLLTLLQNIPATKIEELICFKFDYISSDAQMLLKCASVAGYDQYSFSQCLLETLILSISQTSSLETLEEELCNTQTSSLETLEEELCNTDIPINIINEQNINMIFQENNFEDLIESLIEAGFLVEVDADMSDSSSIDSNMYRFNSKVEQQVVNGLMLDEQKKKAHFEVAKYYQKRCVAETRSVDESNSQASLTTSSTIPALGWQLLHIIALHYDLAGATVQAMLYYFDSGNELATLGLRDHSHGSLLSSYLMLEKRIHSASLLDTQLISEKAHQKQLIVKEMLHMIGNTELSRSILMLTQEHLKFMFLGDINVLMKCITMLTKFGQSVGTIEEDGFKFGSDLYLQAIYLLLLALKGAVFYNLKKRLTCFFSLSFKNSDYSQTNVNEKFCITDLTVSFPAFSGLLTFYRDSPMGINAKQETFLANLFVAITEESKESVHILRTKCILCHLYLKHGDAKKALNESESIIEMYDHDKHSITLVKLYGMDWALVCIGTMASVYLYRGEGTAAFKFVHFLELQILKLDEFLSSTKAMMKQIVSSFYLIFRQYNEAVKLSNGIASTSYSYFYKPSGVLQEKLSKNLLRLHNIFTMVDCSIDLWQRGKKTEIDHEFLPILSSEDAHTINNNRGMLNLSIEVLNDRGIEAINAALCIAKIEILEIEKVENNLEVVQIQMQVCQCGLVFLEQSLQQEDAKSYEKITNYLSCLYQKTELLYWYDELLESLIGYGAKIDSSQDQLWHMDSGINSISLILNECQELSVTHDYTFMLLLVGTRYIELNIDRSRGEHIISRAMEKIGKNKLSSDQSLAGDYLDRWQKDLIKKKGFERP